MVQTVKSNGVWTFYGLSTDDKDAARETIPAPSFRPLIFNEVDTGKKYYFDEGGGDWVEWGTAPVVYDEEAEVV